MLKSVLDSHASVIISTENVLNVNDLRKKAGQKPAEELFDAVASALNNLQEPDTNSTAGKYVKLTRKDNDLLEKVGEHERTHIKIGAKVFLNQFSEKNLTAAVDTVFRTLNIDYLDNLILAYHPKAVETNGVQNGGSDVKEGVIEWGTGEANALGNLKSLWQLLEKYAGDKKIGQLGIADLDVESLKEIYHSSTVHPTITQINLSACCVVPPPLQEFCNSNDIQLLTHSDPQQMITQSSLKEVGVDNFHPTFTVRYQVHIKCRGVIAAKGFLVGLEKN